MIETHKSFLLLSLLVAACSSSSSAAQDVPTQQDVYVRLRLSSVKDSTGKELVGRLAPAANAQLYVTVSTYTFKDHVSVSVKGAVQDRDGAMYDATAPAADPAHGIHFTAPLAIGGLPYRELVFDTNPDYTEHVDGISDIAVPQGLATLNVGDVVTATGNGTFDGGGATVLKGMVTLSFTVEADAPASVVALGDPFAGNQVVPFLPDPVRLSQPGTVDSAVQLSVNGGKRFNVTDAPIGVKSLDAMWFFDASGTQQSSPSDVAPKRTVFFPAGTTWAGAPRAALQLDLTPLPLTALDTVDFSQSATGALPYLAVRGSAKIAQDANCDGAASCLSIEEPKRDDTKACEPSLAAYRVGLTKKGPATLRIRVLGQDAKDGDRVNVGGFGELTALDPLKASTAVPGFTHDSGWISIQGLHGGTKVARIRACAPGVRLMIQSDTAI